MSNRETNKWVVLVLVCFAQFMVVLDATIVNVALPSIQTDLGLSEANLQWIVNAYTLVFGGFLLLGGRAGDLIGRKRLFLAGHRRLHGCFAAERSRRQRGDADRLARAPGPRRRVHLARRALDHLDHVRRGRRNAPARLASGPRSRSAARRSAWFSAALLTQLLSWPWIFFVNVPVGIVTFALALRLIPESRDEHAHRVIRRRRSSERDRGPDVACLRDRQGRDRRLGLARRRSASSRCRPFCSRRSW